MSSKKGNISLVKYSDLLADWLVDFGYAKCFSLGGGNIMHLTESVSRRLELIPVVHEVTAGIAAEYFNECSSQRAFALVTTGPGLTNIVTAIAGAHTESRELLVIGGQVKTPDLATGGLRQRGIQEVYGVDIVAPMSKVSKRLVKPIGKTAFYKLVHQSWVGRKGVVFIEIPIDVQGKMVDRTYLEGHHGKVVSAFSGKRGTFKSLSKQTKALIADSLAKATRPVILLGGGVSRELTTAIQRELEKLPLPLMTTYNGADRIDAMAPNYFGRPNTWGMRYSNVLIQQADLVIVLGSRLGLQQTGFNFNEFAPLGKLIQVDIDSLELRKGHPRVDIPILADANEALQFIINTSKPKYGDWLEFCRCVKETLPLNETSANKYFSKNYISPYQFFEKLSKMCTGTDLIIPCSSGGAFTSAYQSFLQRAGQIMVSNKSLASMGYGLAGALGASVSHPERRVVLIEGDGGFAQNLTELGTVARREAWIKIFIFDDDGYASIRATQRSYFKGRYVGCDSSTGLHLPKWDAIDVMFGVPTYRIAEEFDGDAEFMKRFQRRGPDVFLVSIHPEQTYYPKISSRVLQSGKLESNPLHLMSPKLPKDVAAKVFKFSRRSK